MGTKKAIPPKSVENPVVISAITAAVLPSKNAQRAADYAVVTVFEKKIKLSILDILSFRNILSKMGKKGAPNPTIQFPEQELGSRVYCYVPTFFSQGEAFPCNEPGPHLGFIFITQDTDESEQLQIFYMPKDSLSGLLDDMETALILTLDNGGSYAILSDRRGIVDMTSK